MNPAATHMKDYESALLYFGARYYDAELTTMWLSVDPMADKYPSMSPYAYCAWNPVKLVDPDGETIWIVGDDGAKYKWEDNNLSCKIGRSYVEIKNAGKFVNGVAKNLNKINGTKEGKIVLDELSQSNEDYFIRSKQIGNSDAGYVSSQNSLYMNGLSNISVLSHELFHAYQDENGRSPRNIYNEVEAYVFQGIMEMRFDGNTRNNTGVQSTNGDTKHTTSMMNLIGHYNSKDFNYAVSHFRRDSQANSRGKYKDYGYIPEGLHCGNSLLKKIK